jgi:hypothetical protein
MATQTTKAKTTKAKTKPEAADSVELVEVSEVIEAPAQVAPDFTVKDLAKTAQRIKAAHKGGQDVRDQVVALIDQHKVLLRYRGLTDADRRFTEDHMKALLILV